MIAHLESGIAHGGPWGTALDGLLAAQLHAATKAAELADPDAAPRRPMLEQASPTDLPLPLARCELAGADWHWAATTAQPRDGADLMPDVRYWSARTDSRHLETLAEQLPQHLRERNGRYRARWMPTLVTICTSLEWSCVGDEDEIRSLLGQVRAIGKRRTSGQGRVMRWEVHPSERDTWSAGHLHPDGGLGRPTPPACLTGRAQPPTGGSGTAGLRPPYVHPERQRWLHLPVTL